MDMSKKKSFKWVWIIAVVAVVVLIVVLLSSGNKSVAASQHPAVDQDWLELPGAVNNDNYEVNTYYDSSVRNYTHLYDKDTYTSLWTAYPLNSTYMGSEPRPSKWAYSTSIDTRHQVNLRNRSYNDSYTNYTVSVDQIEQWTGFDFFVNLPDPIESAAESNASWSAFQSF